MSAGIPISQLAQVIDSLQLLLHRHAQVRGTSCPKLAEATREAIQQLRWMKRRLLAEQLVVAFVGLTNTGKSTLLNALLGEAVAPKWNGPCSSAPVEFRHGPAYRATVSYRNNPRRAHHQCGSVEELRETIKWNATENGSTAAGTVERLVAELPAPLLATGLVIADTPGFGAAQPGAAAGKHHQSLVNYLPQVHQAFWVVRTSGEISISGAEADFYRQCLRDCCDDLVVTGAEHLDPADRAQFMRFCREQLGVHFLRFHFVSGKQGYAAKRDRDASLLHRSGVPELEARLTEVADTTTRLSRIAVEVMNFSAGFGAWLSRAAAVPDCEQRWDCVKVEWLNILHHAGRFEATDEAGLHGWRENISRALKGAG